jgi:hypothetical protein
MIRPATRALIEQAHRHSAFYRGFLANHLPMGLVALDAMGATDGDLLRFTRAYEQQLEALGDGERQKVDAFEARITKQGLAAVVASLAPDLMPGIGSAAFHGAIRLAYAVESGIPREQAHAFAYWTMALEPLPATANPSGREAPLEVLRAIARDPAHAGKRPAGRSIAVRMDTAARDPAFAIFVARLDPAWLRLDALAAALIRAYVATGDFTLLHGVTGCHAFSQLAPLLPDAKVATLHLWNAIVAAYMSSGSPAIEGSRLAGSDTLDWPAIHEHAVACEDEHDVKLAYSCWREWQVTSDDIYRRAASARVSHALALGAH